jgi:subtilisin-like proprotein convertase family protein
MKIASVILGTLLLGDGLAQTVSTVYTPTLDLPIPDGNPNGLRTTLEVSDLPNRISDLNVFLNITGGWNGDFYACLSHGSRSAVLLNRTGRSSGDAFGYGDTGFSGVKLDDQAGADIHLYQSVAYTLDNGRLTGSWQPDGRTADPQGVLATNSRISLLESFNGRDPNGTWTLFICDMAGLFQSTLVSWGLEITAAPEPAGIGLAMAALAAAACCGRRGRREQGERP